jgi:hypothetical protein
MNQGEIIVTKFKTLMLAAVGFAIAGSAVATGASAETYFQATHPRRAEVNHRLAVQDHRINAERREGLISARRAHYLHRQDRRIRREERIDARFDRSHVTRGEDRALNHQENQVSREIGRR